GPVPCPIAVAFLPHANAPDPTAVALTPLAVPWHITEVSRSGWPTLPELHPAIAAADDSASTATATTQPAAMRFSGVYTTAFRFLGMFLPFRSLGLQETER